MTGRHAEVRRSAIARETMREWAVLGAWCTQFAAKVEQLIHAQLK